MKKLIYIVLVLYGSHLRAQTPTISPEVINSAGDHRQLGTSGVWITDNVGEPFTETLGANNMMITQGFIQPEIISIGGFSLEPRANNVTCIGKKDGNISLAITSPPLPGPYTATYIWSPSGACPGNNCSSIDSLVAGTYSVMVVVSYTNVSGQPKTDTLRPAPIVITDNGEPCRIKIYSGISANGDGDNDTFTIENIEEFPRNRVTIYNRWGLQMADIQGYHNGNNSWPAKDILGNLLASTYFYIVDLGDGSKPIKGWVELIKN